LRFKSPKQYQFFSVGRKTKEWIEGDFLCTEWKVEVPVHIVAFDYDNFDTYEDSVEGLPSVCVNYLKEAHRKLASHEMYGWFRSWEYTKSKENAAADVINSLNFFQMVYGKCPFSKIVAAEIPASHGRGLPGLVRLSFGSFAQDEHFERNKFRLRSFRGHEVSHQWWGHLVGWQTYHDQWLSEGFAEYSGAWFAQMSMQDNEAFFDELEEWKEDIMGKGFKGSVGSKAGPIWLGHRLNSSESSDYGTVVYEKGAYVLHMLRNMMMNYETRSDSSFIAMMRDFVETYYGKEASTEDFKEMVEKHVGEDMDWFFDQWVYGIEIPTYEFSYTTKETPGGKYIVTCEVDQENVSEDFKMWVPILLDFGMDQHAILRLWVDKPHNVYQLPKAPMMPRQVTLNPAHAVLCEVKTRH
jgi:predicted metalloprotease with PDZ domain